MTDIYALNRALPCSQLKSAPLAELLGLDGTTRDDEERTLSILLTEPPISKHEPYIDPLEALSAMLDVNAYGLGSYAPAEQLFEAMKKDLAASHWMVPYSVESGDSNGCLSAREFVAYLRALPDQCIKGRRWVTTDILDWIDKAAQMVSTLPLISDSEDDENNWTLVNQRAFPAPGMMFESVTTPPWAGSDFSEGAQAFKRWLKGIVPIAKKLEKALGKSLIDSGYIDEEGERCIAMHRNLLLHGLCTIGPKTDYVRYLLRESASRDVEELKAALLDAKSFALPFDIVEVDSIGYAKACEIECPLGQDPYGVGIMFQSSASLDVAKALIAENMFMPIVLIAPEEILPLEWLEQISHLCHSITILSADDYDDLCIRPLKALAWIKDLYVVAEHPIMEMMGFADISPLLRKFYPIAVGMGVSVIYVDHERMPSDDLESLDSEEEIDEEPSPERNSKTGSRALSSIELVRAPTGTGLRLADGAIAGFDDLNIPYELARRIAAWQRDGANWERIFVGRPIPALVEERYKLEGQEIAQELRRALGQKVDVQFDALACRLGQGS